MTVSPIDKSQRTAARVAAFAYLITVAVVLSANYGIYARFIVAGNTAETVRNIMVHELLFRISIVIHNYRWRLSLAKGEPRYDDLEQKLFEGPVITVPTITIASDFDGPAADGSSSRKKFSGKYSHQVLKGIGHNVPQEAPQAFAKAIVEVDGY